MALVYVVGWVAVALVALLAFMMLVGPDDVAALWTGLRG